MNKLNEIRLKMAELQEEAEDLKELKTDYFCAKAFREMLVKEDCD